MGKVIDPIQNSFLQAIRANRVVNRHTPMAYFLVFPKHYKLTVRVTYSLSCELQVLFDCSIRRVDFAGLACFHKRTGTTNCYLHCRSDFKESGRRNKVMCITAQQDDEPATKYKIHNGLPIIALDLNRQTTKRCLCWCSKEGLDNQR